MAEEKIHNVDVQLRYAVTGDKSAAEQAFRNANQIRQADGPGYATRLIRVDVNPDECEGYRNYVTFSIGVWLKNDHKIYDRCREMAAEYIRLSRETLELNDTTPELVMADWLQQFVETRLQVDWREDTANTDADRIFVQMVQAALGQVDWRELAENWLHNVREDQS